MSLSTELDHQIQVARKGKAGVIPVPYSRVGDYIDIAKNTMYLIGGESGSAKSTMVDDMFLIHPIKWYLNNKTEDIKLSVIKFGMERKQYNYSARWISRLIFEEQGIEIHPKKILGRNPRYRMTEYEYNLVMEYYRILDKWEEDDVLICHENSKNPTGIAIYLDAFAERHGVITHKDKEDKSMENILTNKKYVPNHPNHIVLVITDHIGILAPEQDSKTKSQIDKHSRTSQNARDIYGFSPVEIQQLNRSLSDVHRQRMGDLVPKLSDFADSSSTQQNADVVMAIFDPFRHAINGDPGSDAGYQLSKFKDDKFRTYYRSLHILKNSFESSGIGFPMALHPIYGMLKTLPIKKNITEDIYKEVLSGQYFLDGSDESQESIEKQPFSFSKSS